MSKVSYEDKISTLDMYIQAPISTKCKPVLRAIRNDVVKVNAKSSGNLKSEKLYNEAMGVYRTFLKSQNTLLKLEGKKARQYKDAMLNILSYVRDLAKSNNKPHDDTAVIKGLTFIFIHWERLNKFHQSRLGLPEIYNSIEEIIPQVRNGNHLHRSNERGSDQKAFGKL